MQSRWHLKNQKIDQHQKLYQQIKIKINMSKVRKIDQKLYQKNLEYKGQQRQLQHQMENS